MIKVKHLFDAVETDDGIRVWVEPGGLARDLQEWCQVSHLLNKVAPPAELRDWFDEHPDGYEFFRGQYHEFLSDQRNELLEMARQAQRENFTLIHVGDDPNQNVAAALHEFISELDAYCAQDP